MNRPLDFLTQVVGAFIFWMFTGFKGEMEDQMARRTESNWKYFRNILLTAIACFLAYSIFFEQGFNPGI